MIMPIEKVEKCETVYDEEGKKVPFHECKTVQVGHVIIRMMMMIRMIRMMMMKRIMTMMKIIMMMTIMMASQSCIPSHERLSTPIDD